MFKVTPSNAEIQKSNLRLSLLFFLLNSTAYIALILCSQPSRRVRSFFFPHLKSICYVHVWYRAPTISRCYGWRHRLVYGKLLNEHTPAAKCSLVPDEFKVPTWVLPWMHLERCDSCDWQHSVVWRAQTRLCLWSEWKLQKTAGTFLFWIGVVMADSRWE